MRALQRVPDPHLRGPRIREQHVAFLLRPVPVDHHVDGVARLDGYRAVRLAQLLNGDNAFQLIADVDDRLPWE